ncbi:MAG TPA: SCO family protein [Blastocatellia bacterium]
MLGCKLKSVQIKAECGRLPGGPTFHARSSRKSRGSKGGGRIALRALAAALFLWSGAFYLRASAQPAGARPPVLQDVGIDQLLNNQVPLDLEFRDESGRTVKLAEYFKDKPVVLSLVYYECPRLCTQILNGLLGALKTLPMRPGNEFVNLTVSFDPRETPDLAAAKKTEYLTRYNKPGSEAGWHFLTGDEASIKALTKAVGFRYVWDPVTKQYAHASGIMVLTPQGKVSRYLYGIEYAPRDLRFAVIDASAGKVGSIADQIILYCYMYDPERGTYGLVVMRLLRIFAIFTLVTLSALFIYLRRKEKQRAAQWEAQHLARNAR